MRYRLLAMLLLFGFWTGCGTTKWTDTSRTATEQLLISDSVERAVSELDFRAIAGKKVFLDDAYVKNATDTAYLVSSLRQHILASGAVLKDKREEADYIVEVRAGAVGTDRHDVLFGVPQTTIPSVVPFTAAGATIPELPLVKRTEQRAVTKVAVFAYNRLTGRPIWQSGVVPSESKAKAVWVFGAGPFQRGTIYQGTKFAGDRVKIPLIDPMVSRDGSHPTVSVAEQAYFTEPREELVGVAGTRAGGGDAGKPQNEGARPGTPSPVVQASHSNPSAQPVAPPPGTAIPADAPATPPAGFSPPMPHGAGAASIASPPTETAPSTPPQAMGSPAMAPGDRTSGYPIVDPLPFYRR